MKTLKELSHDTFYKMENYSQLIIDLVEEVEELYTYEADITSFGAMHYTVDNILEVVDKSRVHDVEVLEAISKILEQEVEKNNTIEVKQ
jgi:hypothetical protein